MVSEGEKKVQISRMSLEEMFLEKYFNYLKKKSPLRSYHSAAKFFVLIGQKVTIHFL